jgi:hypothetical protein
MAGQTDASFRAANYRRADCLLNHLQQKIKRLNLSDVGSRVSAGSILAIRSLAILANR